MLCRLMAQVIGTKFEWEPFVNPLQVGRCLSRAFPLLLFLMGSAAPHGTFVL